MKKRKFLASVLAGSLITTSISPFISQEVLAKKDINTLRAGDTINNRKVKEVIDISASNFIKAIEESYSNGAITKKEYDSIKSKLSQRWSINGKTKIVVFWDGAFDLYLNSALSYTLVGVSTAGVAALLAKAAAAAGAASLIVSGIRTAGNYMWGLVSFVASNDLSRGLIIYFKKSGYSKPIIYYPSQIRTQ